MKAVTCGGLRLCSVIYWMTRLLWSSSQFVSCRTLIVEGTVSDERRRSRSHFHHTPRLTFHDRSKLFVTPLNFSIDRFAFLWNMRRLFKWFIHFIFEQHLCHPVPTLVGLVSWSVCCYVCPLIMVLFALEPCGPHRWNSSIHCVTVKHQQQHGPLVRNGYGMKVTQEKSK